MSKGIVSTPERVAEFLLHPVAQGFLDSVSDGVLILDAGDRRVVAMNRTARELLDYEEGDVVGAHCADVMNSPACTLACPLTALVEGRPEGGELDLFYRGRDGDKLIHARTRMVLVRDPQGEPLAGIEVFSDSRPIRELEKRLGDRRSRGLVGGSPGMQRVFDQIEQIAPYDVPVVIFGEPGVGKELAASAIHQASRRADAPYVRLDCRGLSTELASSQLFGHGQDAFPGAGAARIGAFEEADGGTLVLDEVFDLPMEVQTLLVRALEDGEIRPAGDLLVRRVDVRVIGLTRWNPAGNAYGADGLDDASASDELRERLMASAIRIPPLRERPEDVPRLAAHFARAIGAELGRGELSIAEDAAAALQSRPWPGNAGELQRALRLAAGRTHGREIRAEHLEAAAPAPPGEGAPRTLAEIERAAIDEALQRSNGNMAEAAEALGIHRSTLWRKVRDDKQS